MQVLALALASLGHLMALGSDEFSQLTSLS